MTRLNNYNRSTHDLSFVMRTTMAPGVLVPTMKQLVLPGDTFPIQTRCHTLTHPTIGPLFGSFKQQNDFFFCPMRLYNAMLHNNALNIGLDMKKVKFPYTRLLTSDWEESYLEGSADTLKRQVHPSSLPAYLGYKALSDENSESDRGSIQVLPILMYFDIFKNYYANKQENSFYQIIAGGDYQYSTNNSTNVKTFCFTVQSKVSAKWSQISKIGSNPPSLSYDIPVGSEYYIGFSLTSDNAINEDDTYIYIGDIVFDSKRYGGIEGYLSDLLNKGTITRSTPTGNNTKGYVIGVTKAVGGTHTFFTPKKVQAKDENSSYAKIPLSDIDDMREDILAAGKTAYEANSSFINNIFKTFVNPESVDPERDKYPACAKPMVGLVLKTYQSDINTNWVNTEWIDGETGINAITAIDTSGGSFTLDTLNLAKKYTLCSTELP